MGRRGARAPSAHRAVVALDRLASAVRVWRKGLDRLEEGSDRGRLAGDLDAFGVPIAWSLCGQEPSEGRVRRSDGDVGDRLGARIGAELPSGPVADEGVV